MKILSLAGHDIDRDAHDYLKVCLKRADNGKSREPPDLYPRVIDQIRDRLLPDDQAGPAEEPAQLREQLEEKRTSGRNGAPG